MMCHRSVRALEDAVRLPDGDDMSRMLLRNAGLNGRQVRKASRLIKLGLRFEDASRLVVGSAYGDATAKHQPPVVIRTYGSGDECHKDVPEMIGAGYQVEDTLPIDLMAREASWGSHIAHRWVKR
jgi:hypothetical protein